MIRYHASWVVPIGARPIRSGWVAIDRDAIVSFGGEARGVGGDSHAKEVDLGGVAIMPGLVNAHTHLELSYLKDRVPTGPGFVTWIRELLVARRKQIDPRAPEILEGISQGIEDALRSGTAVVGDISNTLATFGPLSRSRLAAMVFHELIGFNPSDSDALVNAGRQAIEKLPQSGHVHASLAAHAPYSVAPSVFKAIRHALDQDPGAPCSVHLGESEDEVEFLRTATGPWRTLLEDLGAWNAMWSPPGTSPVEYLDANGFLGSRVLAVHGVQMTAGDLSLLAARGTTLVTCPRSNVYTRAGTPPIEAFYRSGVRVAVGTDSLASAPDLNLFSELTMMRTLAPSVPASAILDSATRQGAEALGFGRTHGTITAGKQARLLAVTVPSGIDDVEEYLVSGIEPDQVRWLES